MVALYDSASVPGSGSTQVYSTLVLVVPAYPASTVWTSTSGGVNWTMASTAPWAVNAEVGNRKGMAMAVDASNNVFITGGNTATADLWVSADKGVTWSLVSVSAGSSYAASYAACLGVRYPTTSASLVLFSGQIYSSVAVPSGAVVPSPSQYATSFALTATSTQPLPNSAAPAAVHPGATQGPIVYFTLQYSQSPLYQLQTGLGYTVCLYGQLTVTPHLLFGECAESTPCYSVYNASGVRVFANETVVVYSNLTDVLHYSAYNATTYNYIFPASQAKVDYEGITFTFSSFPVYNGYAATANLSNYYQVDDTQMAFLDSRNRDTNAVGTVFNLSTTPFPSSVCPSAVVPPPPAFVSSGTLPRILSTIDCTQQVGTVFAGSGGGQCPQSAANLGINLVVTGVTSPYVVILVGPGGALSTCITPSLNSTNAAAAQQIACFPSTGFNVTNVWIGVRLQTLSGYSNTFPALLFGSQNAPPWPPAIYSVSTASGSGCSAASQLQQQTYGYTATVCAASASTPLTINGEWFTAATTAYVGGVPCSSQTLVSATQLLCVQPSAISSANTVATAYNLSVSNAVGPSIAFTGLFIGLAPFSYFSYAAPTAVPYAAASGSNLAVVDTLEPTCLVDYRAVWARSASVEMWAISGGVDYENEVANVVKSITGFASYTATIPTYTVANAILRNRKAGGAVLFQNGTAYPAGSVFMWGGNTDENVGDAALYLSTDDFVTIGRPRTNAAPSPCPYAPCTTSPVYARFAYAVLPFTNYIVQVGGAGNGVAGTNDVFFSSNQGFGWTQVNGSSVTGVPSVGTIPPPFPPFLSGSMVALYDSASVPGSGSTQAYSTLVLVVPAYPASTVWSSITGGLTWVQLSSAPWAINQEVGQRKGLAMTVDADNHVFVAGGNTATADLWVSADKGVTWSLIGPAGTSGYGASFGSCLGVRYTAGATQPTLVLYSGQIYTSLTTASTLWASPTPTQYAMTFPLQGLTAPLLANSAAPVAVYPGSANPTLYFYLQYQQSPLYQLVVGTAYEVCYTGRLTVTPHLLFGECGAANPCLQVLNATGVRVFSNQTVVLLSQVIGLYNNSGILAPSFFNDSDLSYLFPLTAAKVDSEGLKLYHSSPLVYDNYVKGGTSPNTTSISQSDDTQTSIFDSANAVDTVQNVPSNFSFQLSTTNSLPSCGQQLQSPPVAIISTGGLPKLFSTIDCTQQIGTVFAGTGGGQCPQSIVNLGINLVVTGVSSPFQVVITGPNGTGLCTSPALNDTNPAHVQQIACFPGFNPTRGNQWAGIFLRTLAGVSNTFPALLYSTQIAPPWPPAIYSVSAAAGSGCSAAPALQQQKYGYNAVVCPSSSTVPLTINGDWFDSATVITVGGVPCASQTLVSSSQITCVQPAAVVANTSSQFAVPELVVATNAVGSTIPFTGLLIGTAIPVQSGYFCALIYSLPGNVDYPWSELHAAQPPLHSTPTRALSLVRPLTG